MAAIPEQKWKLSFGSFVGVIYFLQLLENIPISPELDRKVCRVTVN